MAAAVGAAAHAPMIISAALHEGACLRKQQGSLSSSRASQPFQCNTCHFSTTTTTTTCKMRSRNPSRAYTKKNPEKKVPGKPLSPSDSENTTADGGKDAPEHVSDEMVDTSVVHESATDSTSDQIQSAKNGAPLTVLCAPVEDDEERKVRGAEEAPVQSTSQSLGGGGSLGSDDESFIDIVEDLMEKVKDAERNILMLNEVRMQNLEQLEQLRREKDKLRGQMNVLEVVLAEAEAKLKQASHERLKTEMLEEEIKTLRAAGIQKAQVETLVSQPDTQYKQLSEHAKNLEEKVAEPRYAQADAVQLYAENQALQEKVRLLQSDLAVSNQENELVTRLHTEKESLQSVVANLEAQLETADSSANELAKLKAEKQIILEKLGKMETDQSTSTEGARWFVPMENGPPPLENVQELQTALLRLEVENNLLEQARAENTVLREQIKMLEERLVQSDAEIRSQLEVYQAEVESFQETLEQLKLEKDAGSGPVDDMPWEFWSQALLAIDGWSLEKRLLSTDAIALREMTWQRDRKIKDVFLSKTGASDDEKISALLDLLKAKKRPGMHIVHIAAEMAPVAKVGGLGDVVTGLGKSFQRRGHLVEVVLPKYDCMDYSRITNLKVVNMDLMSYFNGHTFKNKVWLGTVEGLPVYFIEPHHPAKLFWRGQIYGENDDFTRFTYFSRAALEFVLQSSKKPDIIHCHDWHTAAVAPMYWDIYVPQGLDCARLAFTCHNFEYQGAESPAALAACGLDPQRMHRPDRMQDNFVLNRINLLKGGIVFSNIVTTVSPTYAQEVQGAEGGKGLHVTLMAHAHKFHGILNGIDTEAWNPASDMLIDHQYSADDIGGKAANKAALRARLSLSAGGLDAPKPLVGCITRLVPQKGVHLIRHAIFRTLDQGGQFVLLGSSPIQHIQREFEAIANQFSHHPHVRLILKYDESLSHSIYAAADIFIIPSIFEPCGLTQMIAMRYGAIPVARKTGGLNDSVFDVDDETLPLQTRNGFTFPGVNEEGLNYALDRALKYCIEQPEWWKDLVKRTMLMDFSWSASADQYAELYQKAIARSRSVA